MWYSLKVFWKHIENKKAIYIIAYLLTTITTLLSLLPAKLIGIGLDFGINVGNTDIILYAFLGVMVVILLKTSLRYLMVYFFESATQTLCYSLRTNLYDKMQRLDNTYLSTTTTGEIMAKLTGDLDLVRHMFSYVLYSTYENILLFVTSFIFLATINLKLTLLLLICAPFIVFINIKIFKSMKPVFVKHREAYSQLNTTAQENITGNRTVKAFVREEYEMEKMRKQNDTFRDMNIEVNRVWVKNGVFIDFFSNLLSVIALIFGGYFTIKGEMTIGDFSIFLGTTWGLCNPLRMSGPLLNDLQRVSASADKLLPLYFSKPIIKDPENPIANTKKCYNIAFENVGLKFGNNTILEDINLNIKHGETIGIMGPTGAGKTMLISSLLRFHDVTSGKISIDDINIKDYRLKELRSVFGLSPQDIFLFSNTIEGDIAYYDPEMPFEDIEKFAKYADADTFIKRTPDGYGTIVGERGVGLSGGQKQRITLARALAKKAPVLILDDTTSSVDMETESNIQKSLGELKDCTKIIIAQRISSVYNADKIIIIENGKITQSGTHDELVKQDGYYKRIYDIQMNYRFEKEAVI